MRARSCGRSNSDAVLRFVGRNFYNQFGGGGKVSRLFALLNDLHHTFKAFGTLDVSGPVTFTGIIASIGLSLDDAVKLRAKYLAQHESTTTPIGIILE